MSKYHNPKVTGECFDTKEEALGEPEVAPEVAKPKPKAKAKVKKAD